ncbi:MAG: LytTR family DNA-binding domain-containing protein [Clostridium sp.]|nr:LytTR family DNA-binding domain-containing protein [Clostridium sp.]
MYEIAVCGGRKQERDKLTERIWARKSEIELCIYEYDSGEELLEGMSEIVFSLIFLDIELPGMSGVEAAEKLRRRDPNIPLVIYTSLERPPFEIFELQPFRYMTKCLSLVKADEYIRAALIQMAANGRIPSLMASVHREQLIVRASYIIYIEKYKKSTRIHMTEEACRLYGLKRGIDGQYPDVRCPERLEHICSRLEPYGFACPHDSYIINFEYLMRCTSKSLKLEETVGEFQIARSKSKLFQKKKEKFFRARFSV